MEQFGLPSAALDKILSLLAQYQEIEAVKIYGSRAMGTHWRGSDIDLAIFGNCEAIVGNLLTRLDELPLPYKFDVSDYSRIKNQELKQHIDRVGKIIYSR